MNNMWLKAQQEAEETTLSEAIAWAKGQAQIWREKSPATEPARTYMLRRYELLVEAAEAWLDVGGN